MSENEISEGACAAGTRASEICGGTIEQENECIAEIQRLAVTPVEAELESMKIIFSLLEETASDFRKERDAARQDAERLATALRSMMDGNDGPNERGKWNRICMPTDEACSLAREALALHDAGKEEDASPAEASAKEEN